MFVFDNSIQTGYNALYLYPTDVSVFRNYNNIIFLDPILDKSYLSEINKHSKGQIYIHEEGTFNKKLFYYLNINIKNISDFLLKLSN